MDISDKKPILPINSYVQQVQGNPAESRQKPDKAPEAAGPVEDNVDLSQAAKDLQNTRKIMQEIPDVRHEKVEHLREQVENGTYRVDAKKLADKMIKDSLINDLLS